MISTGFLVSREAIPLIQQMGTKNLQVAGLSPSSLWHTWSKLQMCWVSVKCHREACPSLGMLPAAVGRSVLVRHTESLALQLVLLQTRDKMKLSRSA